MSSYRNATQSTTTIPPRNDPNINDANNALDKDVKTCTKTKDIGKNANQETVWWKVDLNDVYNIYSISILFRNYSEYGIY